jgi:hypothetical protein
MATLGYPLADDMQLIDLAVRGIAAGVLAGVKQSLQDVVYVPDPPVGREQGYMDR